MVETESSTPQTAVESQLKAAKDKNCPFCGQAFTSSSLGRHLDLYIRPKNPKAPDGVHKVEEIRRMRGSITRRQFKGNVGTSRRGEGSTRTPTNRKHGLDSEDSSMVMESPEGDEEEEQQQQQLAMAKLRTQRKERDGGHGNRQPSTFRTRTPDVRRETSRQLQKAELEQRQKTSEEAEVASATEMALRELLNSVQEASAKASGCSLFDFDPYALSFPSLCLHILPAPPTLFSPSPFSTSDSWSTSVPGQKQFDALNRQVHERILSHDHQRRIHQACLSTSQCSATDSPLAASSLDFDAQKVFGHIADAYAHWTCQPEKTKQEHWQLEILRCFIRTDERRRDAEWQLEKAQREIECLKAKARASGAPEIAPVSICLGRETARDLAKSGVDFTTWDYDRLIEKWRSSIRDSRALSVGLTAQKPLPGDSAMSRNGSLASLPLSYGNATRQGSPVKSDGQVPLASLSTINRDTHGHHLDAQGDDDDGDGDDDDNDNDDEDEDGNVGQSPPTTMSDQGMVNHIPIPPPAPPILPHQHQHQHQRRPQHSLPLQPAAMHTSQQLASHMQPSLHVTQAQAHAHLQHAQAQAHAHAWAAAHQHMAAHVPHQPLSSHALGSASTSRRPSGAMLDPLALTNGGAGGLNGGMGMAAGMDGIDGHDDHFLRLNMSLTTGFLGGNDGVSLGS